MQRAHVEILADVSLHLVLLQMTARSSAHGVTGRKGAWERARLLASPRAVEVKLREGLRNLRVRGLLRCRQYRAPPVTIFTPFPL